MIFLELDILMLLRKIKRLVDSLVVQWLDLVLLLTWPRFSLWSGVPQALHTAPPNPKKEKKKNRMARKRIYIF